MQIQKKSVNFLQGQDSDITEINATAVTIKRQYGDFYVDQIA